MSVQSASPLEGNSLKNLPWVAIVIAGLLVATYAWIFRSLPFGENPAGFGGFGDYIGGLLNPLISLFTLVVAVSVWKLQKTELLETRKAIEEQGKTADQQRREQRFFDFLNIYHSTVDSIEFETVSLNSAVTSVKGKRALKLLTSKNDQNPFKYFSAYCDVPPPNYWHDNQEGEIRAWNRESPNLDHYFRVVFTLLREAEPTLRGDHWRYMKLLRAQLSRDEVNLLAMNLLFDVQGRKMRPLVESYGMLKHLPRNKLRVLAERDLSPTSFGRTWAQIHQGGTDTKD